MMYSLKCLTKASRLRGLGTHRFQAMTTVVQGKESSSDGSWTGKYSKEDTVTLVGIVTVIVSSTSLATAYTVSTNRDLREQIALAETEIAAIKLKAKKDLEAIKLETKRRVAEAKRETAERLLLFGYRAEFLEFQKQLKLGDHAGKEETSAKE